MRKKFLERLDALARLCGFELDEIVVAMYDKTFQSVGYELACVGVERMMLERRSGDKFPSIADLMKAATGKLDDLDVAVEASSRIVEAVTRIGRYNPAEAQAHIGEVGWYVVMRNGGWANVCTQLSPSNLTTMKSQWRDLALSAIKRNRLGLLNVAPSFEQPQIAASGELKRLVDGTVKLIGGTRSDEVRKGSEGTDGHLPGEGGSQRVADPRDAAVPGPLQAPVHRRQPGEDDAR